MRVGYAVQPNDSPGYNENSADEYEESDGDDYYDDVNYSPRGGGRVRRGGVPM